MKYVIEMDSEELDAALFAIKGDLETVLNDPEEWSIGEILSLQTLVKKLEGARHERNIKLSDDSA